jgi:hypothetical protein
MAITASGPSLDFTEGVLRSLESLVALDDLLRDLLPPDRFPVPNESERSESLPGFTLQLNSESWKCSSRIPMRPEFAERGLSGWGIRGGDRRVPVVRWRLISLP